MQRGRRRSQNCDLFRTTWLQQEEIVVEIRKAIISRKATHDLPQNAPPPQLPQFVG
jgi:hypothetical protein